MTAKPVRNLSIVEWIDPLAWTESMKGKPWSDVVKRENLLFSKNLKKNVKQQDIEATQCALQMAMNTNHLDLYETESESVQVKKTGTFFVEYQVNKEQVYSCVDVSVNAHGDIWNIIDIGNGSENYCLRYFKKGSGSADWYIQHVGPSVIVLGNHCFFLECRKSLVYYRLVSVNATTGKDYKVWYEEKDPRYNLSLVRGEHHTAYLVSENSGLQKAWFFHEESKALSPCEKGKEGFFVLGGGAPNDYFFTEGRGTDAWTAHGPRISRWKLPDFSDVGIPESVWVHHGLLVTRKQGVRSLWHCSSNQNKKSPVQLFSDCCMIDMNSWGIFCQQKNAQLRISRPGLMTQSAVFQQQSLHISSSPKDPYGSYERHFTKSSDGSQVPYILVKPVTGKCKALLVIGYGAYGLPTVLMTGRWKPLLDAQWAICFALVRGGGDDTLEWANAARTYKRKIAIDDFLAVIENSRLQCDLTPKHVAIYGRSAGGLLVGGAAGRQPKGNTYFSAVYAEVPYLDLLRTTSNPSLPLTELEYEEFGNPRENLEDLVTLGQISPVDIIPKEGYPKLFSLMRTGKNDKQVLTYEPVKWTLRARNTFQNAPKLLAIWENQGHFVHGSSGLEQQAVDLELLKAWMKGWKSA